MSQTTPAALISKRTIAYPDLFLFHPFLLITDVHSKPKLTPFTLQFTTNGKKVLLLNEDRTSVSFTNFTRGL